MPFVSPPNFANGNVLSASQLNTLSNDIEYLNGLVQQTNPGFYAKELGPGSGITDTEQLWVIRHKTNTFKYRAVVIQGTIDFIRFKYGATTIFTDNTDGGNPYIYSGTVDLTSFGFVVGDWYRLTFEAGGKAGSAVNRVIVYDMREIFG